MESVNAKAGNSPPLRPCEYFDMICGTSTGGYGLIYPDPPYLKVELFVGSLLSCSAVSAWT